MSLGRRDRLTGRRRPQRPKGQRSRDKFDRLERKSMSGWVEVLRAPINNPLPVARSQTKQGIV